MNSRRLFTVIFLIGVCVAAWMYKQSTPETPPEDLFRQALQSLNSGQSAGVEAAFERLASDDKFGRHLALLDAVLFLRGGKPEEALRRLSPVTMDNEVRELSLLYVGEALYTLTRLAEAQQVLQLLRTEFPHNLDARRWLGVIYYDIGAYDAAISEMEAVAESAPEDYRPHYLLGVMYQDFEVEEDAIAQFRMALERQPPQVTANKISTDLATVLISNRQYEEALKILESLPKESQTLQLRAKIYWNQGLAEQARNALAAAEADSPLTADGLHLQATIAEDEGNIDEAIAILEQLLKDFPDRLESRYQLAMTLQQDGQEDRAAKELKVWEQNREVADQLIQLNLQAVSDPYDAEVRDQLAELCEQLGRTQLADMWRRAAQACRRGNAVLGPG